MTGTAEAALGYAARGWRVFPVHSAAPESGCSCRRPVCNVPGKHPVETGWLTSASSDADVVARMWTDYAWANIGLATGSGSGVWVLDVDGAVGFDTLAKLEEENGESFHTLATLTGGLGRHLFFTMPTDGGTPLKNKVKFAPGLDLRTDGGFVVLPPSRHITGNEYTWLVAAEVTEAPELLLKRIRGYGAGGDNQYGVGRESPHGPLPSAEEILSGIAEGQRDDVLFRWGCSLRRRGLSKEEARVLVRVAAAAAKPPFPREEADRKVESAWSEQYLEQDFEELENPQGAIGARNLTDDGNALRLIDRFGQDLRRTETAGWLIWDGQRWQRDETMYIQTLARQTVAGVYEEAEAAIREDDRARARALMAHARRSESGNKVFMVPKLAADDRRIALRFDAFDRDPWLVSTQTGTLNLKTGIETESRREDNITMQLGCGFDPSAEAPFWRECLEKWVPSPDVRGFLQRAVGYSLTGINSEKVMFVLHGGGDNGKSVFMETVRKLMGDYAGVIPAQSLVVQRGGGGIPNDIAQLKGKRYVTAAETGEGDHLHAPLIKQLSGGDVITARFMRQEYFQFEPICKIWLGTNHQPQVDQQDNAIWNRLRKVPFEVTIRDEDKIPRHIVDGRLMAELSGILNWALEGLREQQATGLGAPVEVIAATDRWREEDDWLGEFLGDECEVLGRLPEGAERLEWSVTNPDFYSRFKLWADEQGIRMPMTLTKLTRRMKAYPALAGKCEHTHVDKKRSWVGLRLRERAAMNSYGI